MILGLGNDLVDIRRIAEALQRHGDRFLSRVLTPAERDYVAQFSDPQKRAAAFAKRFAAKEAAAKALGTGFQEGVSWQDFSVDRAENGRPSLTVSGSAREKLQANVPSGWRLRCDVSLSDEFPMAQAIVIFSADPP